MVAAVSLETRRFKPPVTLFVRATRTSRRRFLTPIRCRRETRAMTSSLPRLVSVLSCIGLVIACAANASPQKKSSDYDDAMMPASRFLRKKDYPSAVPPLEAALTLAKDDAQ